MIEATGVVMSGISGSGIETYSIHSQGGIEDFNAVLNSNIEQFGLNKQQPDKNIAGAAVNYMVETKNSLISRAESIHDSYLGDEHFSFKDKIQLLEKTYNYQLEMQLYNTFMAQSLQKTDSLINLR